jgi:2-keto-4-pentenoate hydratase/2-oxohepta-3-ene-1,7-dioic acid hydratase in catechol pathway
MHEEIQLTSGERRLVGTVYCMGRNYAKHAEEMGTAPEPVAFIKPAAALMPGGGSVVLPPGCERIDHEVELVLLLGQGVPETDPERALEAIAAVGLGIDLTARDLQAQAKERGGPWARAKGFPGSAPVSAFVPQGQIPVDWDAIDISLTVDGEARQSSTTDKMLLPVGRTVALLSQWFPLRAGDLIFTGTPEGVGPVPPGSTATATSRALDLEVAVEVTREPPAST